MKKIIALVLALFMALALAVPALAAGEEPEIRIGMLTNLTLSEEELDETTDRIRTEEPDKFPMLKENGMETVYYHSLSELLMALDAGYIRLAIVDEPTVQYVLSRNDAYAENHPLADQPIEYSMLFLEEDAALCDSFSEAIKAMEDDGTLDELAAEYIDGVIAGEEPEAVAFPAFDGADTVTVAVTGDVPPMDYVDDAGSAAGFNTAVLAEIAQRLELNIELVQVDSGARTLALSSGRADAVFWVKKHISSDKSEAPEGTVASEAYYTTELCDLALSAQ